MPGSVPPRAAPQEDVVSERDKARPDQDDTRERAIFAACLDLPTEAREPHLERACNGDARLKSRLRRLLAVHRAVAEVDDPVPRGRAERRTPGGSLIEELSTPPETIGQYRIQDVLGEGGMGVVYAAEQTRPVRRQVALKVIKLGMDTKEVIARFESERQALALMNHPGIARILDAGTTDRGRPFFVLEYVPGVPLLTFCDQRKLSVEERLHLFIQVCDAIQHAHHRGIIHRDIKPSNILVTEEEGRATPKVIDFGIAKAIHQRLSEHTLHTELGRFLGTPEYTSPEQAEFTALNVDTRSDVYSLGVVLYELLVGARPLDLDRTGLTYDEVQRRILHEEPKVPSARLRAHDDPETVAAERGTGVAALARALRGELDWITQRALEKNPARRYPSAQALAEDIQRHLDDEPVQASPPTASYRVRKLVRRHRMAFAAATAVVIALCAALCVSWKAYIDVREERNLARQAWSESDAVTGFLAEMLSAVDPNQQGRDVSVRSMLDAAAETIGERFAQQPAIEARLAGTVAETYASLGAFREAAPHFRRRLELFGELRPYDDRERLEAVNSFAMNEFHLGRSGEARVLLEEVMRVIEQGASNVRPEDAARFMSNLASVLGVEGRWPEAEELLSEALALHVASLGDEHESTAMTRNNLAVLYSDLGRYEEAHPLLERGVEFRRRRLGDAHPKTAIALQNLGLNHARLGHWEQAEPVLLEALDALRLALGDEHLTTLTAEHNLAVLLSRHGRSEDALAMLQQTVVTLERVHGPEHPQTFNALRHLGGVHQELGLFEDALGCYRVAVERAARTFDPGHPTLAAYRVSLGLCLLRLKQFEPATEELERALPALRRGLDSGVGSLRSSLVRALEALSAIHERTGSAAKARRYGKEREELLASS